MILTGEQIKYEVNNGKILLEPFNKNQLSTNSYDLRLSNKLVKTKTKIIDPFELVDTEEVIINENGYELNTGEFVLGASLEIIGSDHYVPILHGKSGIARLGVFVHITADLVDIGYRGCITFQIFCTQHIRIYPNMLFAQLSFWKPYGDITLYDGKYQNGNKPQSSKYYLT